jgi:hypothetical protein
MADYQLTETDIVIRTADQANIPNDPANRDWVEYQKWLADGGVPDPAPPPPEPPPPEVTQEQQNAVLLDHENRLRAMAGDPPLTMQDLVGKMK